MEFSGSSARQGIPATLQLARRGWEELAVPGSPSAPFVIRHPNRPTDEVSVRRNFQNVRQPTHFCFLKKKKKTHNHQNRDGSGLLAATGLPVKESGTSDHIPSPSKAFPQEKEEKKTAFLSDVEHMAFAGLNRDENEMENPLLLERTTPTTGILPCCRSPCT